MTDPALHEAAKTWDDAKARETRAAEAMRLATADVCRAACAVCYVTELLLGRTGNRARAAELKRRAAEALDRYEAARTVEREAIDTWERALDDTLAASRAVGQAIGLQVRA